MGWFEKAREKYYGMKTMHRLVITYVLMFCIPLIVLLTLYFNQVKTNLADNYFSEKNREVDRAANVYRDRINNINSLPMLFNRNSNFREYVEGKMISEADLVYSYLEYVVPQIRYVLSANRIINDIQIFRLNAGIKSPPYFFLDEWPSEYGNLAGIVVETSPALGKWGVKASDENSLRLLCHATLYNMNYSRKQAILTFVVDTQHFFKEIVVESSFAKTVLFVDGEFFTLSDQGGMSRASADDVKLIMGMDAHQEMRISFLGRSTLVCSLPLAELGCKLYYISEFSFLSPEDIITVITPVIISLILFTSIFFITLSAGTGRILKLSKHLSQAGYNRLEPYPDNKYSDEIGMLTESYNTLITNIKLLLVDVYQAEIQSRDAKYYALQAQINPHFMLNTLENIRMMAIINGDAQTAGMISILGKMFQYNIFKEEVQATLAEEIGQARNYLNLCLMRMGDSLSYGINSAAELDSVVCPRNIIQPIVENSINHAFANMNGKKRVVIDVQKNGEHVIVTVTDNGIGIGESRLKDLKNVLKGTQQNEGENAVSHGVGLANVHERIRIFYGNGCGVTIDPGESCGTVCRLVLRRGPSKEFDLQARSEI